MPLVPIYAVLGVKLTPLVKYYYHTGTQSFCEWENCFMQRLFSCKPWYNRESQKRGPNYLVGCMGPLSNVEL